MLKILSPKWQNADPEVRREAIESISEEATLLEIIAAEKDETVLKTAINQLSNTETLLKLHKDNLDIPTGASCKQRLTELIQSNPESIVFSTPLAAFLSNTEPALGQLIADKNSDDRFALFDDCKALPSSTLIAQCAEAPTSVMRQNAANALTQEDDIKAAIKTAAHKDKNVSHILREKLAAIRSSQEKHASIDALSNSLLKIGNGEDDWQHDQARLDKQISKWDALKSEADTQQEKVWQEALNNCQEKLADKKLEADKLVPVIESKDALISELESFDRHYRRDNASFVQSHAAKLLQKLDESVEQWQALPALIAHKEEDYNNRFHSALKKHKAVLGGIAKDAQKSEAFKTIIKHAKSLSKRKAIKAKDIDKLEPRWNELPVADDAATSASLNSEFKQLLEKLRTKYQQQKEAAEISVTKMQQWLDDMDTAMSEDQTKAASKIYQKIEQELRSAKSMATSGVKSIEKRLNKHKPKLKELEGWRHWGTDKAREGLIKDAQALAKADIDIKERTKKLKDLRDEWKKLSKVDPISGQRLWKRFDAACTEAHQPIKKARADENAERAKNLEKRKELCVTLEKLETDTDWSTPNWRDIDKTIGQLRNKWRSAGGVQRKKWEKINDRFFAAIKALDLHLDDERRRSINQRNALIEKVEAASELEDVREAINIAKQAQREWTPTVLAKRSEEQKMWKRFRAAVDALFEKDKKVRHEKNAESNKLLDEKKSIVNQLDKISKLEGTALSKSQGEVGKLKSAWQELLMQGNGFDKRAAGVEKKYRAICKQLERNLKNQAANAEATQLGDFLDGKWEGKAATADQDTLQTALLELEIILEVESPADQAKARLQLQVERMADSMSGGDFGKSKEIYRLCEKVGQQVKAGATLDDLATRVAALKPQIGPALAKNKQQN